MWVRSAGTAQRGSLQGHNQGVGQGWVLTWRVDWGRIHFHAVVVDGRIGAYTCHWEPTSGPCHMGLSPECSLALLKSASKRTSPCRADITVVDDTVSHNNLIPSLLPYFMGQKQTTGSSHTQVEGSHKGVNTRMQGPWGHFTSLPAILSLWLSFLNGRMGDCSQRDLLYGIRQGYSFLICKMGQYCLPLGIHGMVK